MLEAAKAMGQWGQVNGLSPVCFRICTLRAMDCVKARPHTPHGKGRSPLCVRRWVLRLQAREKARGQCEHL